MFSPSCPALHPSEPHNLLSLWRWMLLHGDKEGRKAFAYSLLAMMAPGGLGAVPLYKMLASLIRQLFDETSWKPASGPHGPPLRETSS